jgi:hypothetical protein
MKKQTDYTIPLIGFIILIVVLVSSCATVKRYSYESTHLNDGEISKNHVRCEVRSFHRNAQGFKHTLVTEKNDTIYRTYTRPLEVNKCYYIWKTRGEKNL